MQLEDFKENYTTGYIRVFRSTKNKGWYKKSDYVHLWVHLLIKATHKEIEYFFNGENIKLNAGQFITGRKVLSTETGINESKIERILNFFEKNEHQIEQQKTNKNRLISILNWEQYQNNEQLTEQQLNNKRTTTEQQLNTYNNKKNNKNNNKVDYLEKIYFKKSNELDEAFKDYLKIRIKHKYTMTERAVNALIKKLRELSDGNKQTALKIIDNAILGKWKSFYANKD